MIILLGIGAIILFAVVGFLLRSIVFIAIAAVIAGVLYTGFRLLSVQQIDPSSLSIRSAKFDALAPVGSNPRVNATIAVKNTTERYISGASLKVQLRNCPSSSDQDCDAIGSNFIIMDFSVPPGEVREVNQAVTFSNVPAHDAAKDSYAATVSSVTRLRF